MKYLYLIYILPLLYGYNALGQASVKIYAPDSVPLNQQFELDIVCENFGDHDALVSDIYNTRGLKDFIVVNGPNTYTSSTFSNGVGIHSNSYRYSLKPRQIGSFNPGTVTAIINNKIVESDEISIAVTPSVEGSKLVPGLVSSKSPMVAYTKSYSWGDTSAINNAPVDSSAEAIKTAKEDIFWVMKLSKDTVHMGEKLTATLFIYGVIGANQMNVGKLSADGFKIVTDTIPSDSLKHPSEEMINGKKFQRIEWQKFELYPQRTGKLKVGPHSISMVALLPGKKASTLNDFFNPYFDFKRVPLTITADSKTVIVLPKK